MRSHQLSSTGEAPRRQTHHFHHSSELFKGNTEVSFFLLVCASSRSPGTHWAALLGSLCLPVRSSLQCLGPPCTEENAPQGLTVWGGSLNMRGKPGDWECTRCNPAISRSSHKDDVWQRGKGARPYTPGFRTPTLLWDAWFRVPTASLFMGPFADGVCYSLIIPASLGCFHSDVQVSLKRVI